jgi:hypothetical protein
MNTETITTCTGGEDDPATRAAIKVKLAEAVAICRAALAEPEMAGLAERLPEAPANAQQWFELLSNYPGIKEVAALQRMKDAVSTDAAAGFPSVERYAVLQALTVSLPRVNSLPLATPVKLRFAGLAAQVANPSEQWRRNFAAPRLKLMEPMAELATLRQFPAGELIFNYNNRVSYVWPLRFPPRAVPGFLLEVAFGLKGWGPLIWPHINLWRSNPLFVRKVEVERSLWRMAKTLEYRPDVKFLMVAAWFFSADVSKVAPHLAWMRAMYEEEGAYVVSMEPASEDAGFLEGSPRRAELYNSGAFNPRQTLVLWRREDMLAWASRRLDLADEGECAPPLPAARSGRFRVRSSRAARPAKHNSRLHLWNGLELLSRRPRVYVLFVLILPALIISAAAGSIAWWGAVPGFLAAFVAAWMFQYYCFQ